VDALGIFTVSDNHPAGLRVAPQECETAFTKMIEIALVLA
jgi:purine-nucleoside phosphorylase